MNEEKYVQFTVANKTAQETSATLFNVNQLVDVPQVVTYTTNSAIPSVSSNNLVGSAINPLNGDVFSYSDDVDSVFVYDSSGNLIQTITGIGSAGSGNRNDIIYIPVYNCMVVNTDLGFGGTIGSNYGKFTDSPKIDYSKYWKPTKTF
jgi:restriction endonuclease S subunit